MSNTTERDVPDKAITRTFTIIRVRTNGRRPDGSEPRNKYSIDIEIPDGIFPVQVRQNKRFHLSQILQIYSKDKSILKSAAALIDRLESEGMIGQVEGPSVVEIEAPTAGADERTKATSERLAQVNRERAAMPK